MAEPLTPFGLDFSKSSLFFLKLLVCASDDLVGMVDDEEVLFDPIFFRTITGGTLSALSYQPIGGGPLLSCPILSWVERSGASVRSAVLFFFVTLYLLRGMTGLSSGPKGQYLKWV